MVEISESFGVRNNWRKLSFLPKHRPLYQTCLYHVENRTNLPVIVKKHLGKTGDVVRGW